MKYLIISIASIALFIYVVHRENTISDLKADITHLNNTTDIRVRKAINDAKKHTTDSLLAEFESLPPDTIIKIKIKYRYEKIIDTIIVLPKLDQLDYITRELDRLYPNN